ncbi:MAG: ABC transporter permease [Pseudomonadales bacterium]|nr:ABC transporter permease [Pseudomonadales bacterium]
MFSLARVFAIAHKEVLHLRRDRLTGGMIAGIPIIMTLLFGYAINQDVRHLRAAFLDLANTSGSRALVMDAQATQVVDIVARAKSDADMLAMLRRGDISVGIFIPPDFERRLADKTEPVAQLMVDGGDPIVLSAARGLMDLRIGIDKRDAAQQVHTFALRAFYNPERRSVVFIVPGLTGVILTLTMVLFTAIAIVRERERGNLELLITTPVQSLELMVGKILPYILIGYIQVSIILALGVWLFNVPVKGSLWDFYLAVGFFVTSTLTLGLMISTFAASQFQAFQMTFMTFLPQLLLSGYMFPFEGMPKAAQWIAEVFPLTHFLRIVRGIILRGAELGEMWHHMWPLAVFFAVMMSLAVLRFRKRLD